MADWISTIADYGALGVLGVIAFLFIGGKIVSDYHLKRLEATFREGLEKSEERHQQALERVCTTFSEESRARRISYTEQSELSAKLIREVIALLKKQNGS